MAKLRLYTFQQQIISKVLRFYHDDCMSGWVKAPPRTGKTIIFVEVILELIKLAPNIKVLVLAPTLDIMRQNIKKFVVQSGGLVSFTEFHGRSKDLSGQVVFGTYQSFASLMKGDRPDRDFFDLIICDEVHRCLTDLRVEIIDHFNAKAIGFTATDTFTNKKKVANVFDKLIFSMSLLEAIESEYILPIRGYVVETRIDLTDVEFNLAAGEMSSEDVDRYHNVTGRHKAAYDFYQKHLAGLPAIAFCGSVQYARDFAKYLCEKGLLAFAVLGETSKEDREIIYSWFEEGEIDVLCSSRLLIEGWDSPRAQVALNLVPSFSPVDAEQRACRVITPAPGKEFGITVDLIDFYNYRNYPILVPHLFERYEIRQGGYLAASRRLIKKEKEEISRGKYPRVHNLRVSNRIVKIFDPREQFSKPRGRKRGWFDVHRDGIARDIVFSCYPMVDFRNISPTSFMRMQFVHNGWDMTGERLLALFFVYNLWMYNEEEYSQFIEWLYYEEPYRGPTEVYIDE